MDKVFKTEVKGRAYEDQQENEDPEKGRSKTTLQKKAQDRRSLYFTLKDKVHGVTYVPSHTIFGALQTNDALMASITKEQQLKQKDMVFIKDNGKGPAVNTDFPCVLLNSNEKLKITFIDKKGMPEQPGHKNHSHHREGLVGFNVKTRGGDKVKQIMRNNDHVTAAEVAYVCVYAVKGETFQTALKRDKRFSDVIFQKSCALSDCDSGTLHQMSEYVDDHHNKQFKVIVNKNKKCQDRRDRAYLDASEDTGEEPREHPMNTEQVNTGQSASPSEASVRWKPIEGSAEILILLHGQFKDLLKTFDNRKGLKKFFREEYDKSVENFFEVKKVREIMRLCHSVCQIRQDGSPKGTGFLLFDRHVLTNAHVYSKDGSTQDCFSAVFGYEDLENSGTKPIKIKNVFSSFYGKDEKRNHLDYALLELTSKDEIVGYPELLRYCRNSTLENKSRICIVGHPDGAIKKMDPCVVIGIENRKEAENKHLSENVQYYHVISNMSLKGKWGFTQNQITYDTSFFHGSSGSPVFDADGKVIGIHTGGFTYKGKEDKNRSVMEYAYSMQPILDHIKANAQVKGRKDILNILEGKSNESNVSSTEEESYQSDIEMANLEEFSE